MISEFENDSKITGLKFKLGSVGDLGGSAIIKAEIKDSVFPSMLTAKILNQ